MAKIVVPRWFIRAKCLCGGMRLPKKPIYTSPSPSIGFHANSKPSGVNVPVELKDININAMKTVMNEIFDPSDFRFWSVYVNSYGVIQVVVCRKCGVVCLSKYMRRKHFEDTSCGGTLVAAYKLLRPDKRCVVCDEKTHYEKWGIPICSDNCIKGWCFWATKPQALELALNLIDHNNKLAG